MDMGGVRLVPAYLSRAAREALLAALRWGDRARTVSYAAHSEDRQAYVSAHGQLRTAWLGNNAGELDAAA